MVTEDGPDEAPPLGAMYRRMEWAGCHGLISRPHSPDQRLERHPSGAGLQVAGGDHDDGRLAPVTDLPADPRAAALLRVLRPEFRVEQFMPPPGHHLAVKPCQIPSCPRWDAYPGPVPAAPQGVAAGRPERAGWIADPRHWPVGWSVDVGSCVIPGCQYSASLGKPCDLYHRQWNRVAGRLGDPGLPIAAFLPHAILEERPDLGGCGYPGCGYPVSRDGLCDGHRHRWARVGRPPLAELPAALEAKVVPGFSVAGLPALARLEFQYLLQVRTDQRRSRILPTVWRAAVRAVVDAGVDSVRDRPLAQWRRAAPGMPTLPGLFTTLLEALGDLETEAGDEYARDVWRSDRLGYGSEECMRVAPLNSADITQPWLREHVKRYARLRLGRLALRTVAHNLSELKYPSRFLARWLPGPAG